MKGHPRLDLDRDRAGFELSRCHLALPSQNPKPVQVERRLLAAQEMPVNWIFPSDCYSSTAGISEAVNTRPGLVFPG